MSRRASNIGALVFVILLAAFLSRPLFSPTRTTSAQGPPVAEATPSPQAPAETTTTVTPEPEPTDPTTPLDTTSTTIPPAPPPSEGGDFLATYPRGCLGGAAPPNPGLVAALSGGTVTVAPPGGAPIASFAAPEPIGWSASGQYLAAGNGKLFSPNGVPAGSLFAAGVDRWAWSPTGDCAVGIVNGALHFGVPGGEQGVLLNANVKDFSFSPDGRLLALVLDEGADEPEPVLYVGRLASGRLDAQTDFPPGTPAVKLFGWTGDGGRILYGVAGEGVAKRVPVQVTRVGAGDDSGRSRTLNLQAIPHPYNARGCGERTAMIAGDGPGRYLRFAEAGSGLTPPPRRMSPSPVRPTGVS